MNKRKRGPTNKCRERITVTRTYVEAGYGVGVLARAHTPGRQREDAHRVGQGHWVRLAIAWGREGEEGKGMSISHELKCLGPRYFVTLTRK